MFSKKLFACLLSLTLFSGCTGIDEKAPDPSPGPVSGDNHAPLSTPQSILTYKNVALPIVLEGSDVDAGDNDKLTFIIKSQPAHGTLAGSGPDQIYSPAADYVGPDEFLFAVSDGKLESAPEAISITVKAQADLSIAPVAFAKVRKTQSKTVDTIVSNGTDSDATNMAVTSSNSEIVRVGGTCGAVLLKQSTCTLSLKFTPNVLGTRNSTIKITYNNGETNAEDAIVATGLAATPNAPVAQALTFTALKDVEKAVQLMATDADAGTELTYSITLAPTHGTLTAVGDAKNPNFKYKGNAGYVGTDSFKFKAKDQVEFSNEITAAITVINPAEVTIPVGVWLGVQQVANPPAPTEKEMEIQNASATIATQLTFESDNDSTIEVIANSGADACGQSLAAGTVANPSKCKIKLRFTARENKKGTVIAKITAKYFNGAAMASVSRNATGVSSIPGDLDPNFGTNGKLLGITPSATDNERAMAAIQQSDGKLIVAGGSAIGIARLQNFDGTVDPDFAKDDTSKNGIGETPSALKGETASLAIQPDGKLLRMNESYTGDPAVPAGVWFARNLSTGRIDPSFGTNGVVSGIPIYFPIGGSGGAFNSGRRNFWVRPASGSRAMQIVMLGQKSPTDKQAVMARLKEDGSPDTTLSPSGVKIVPGLDYAYDIEGVSLANGRLIIKANENQGGGAMKIVMVDEETLAAVGPAEFMPIALPAMLGHGPSALELKEWLATATDPYNAQFRIIRHGEARLYNFKGMPVTAYGTNGVQVMPTLAGMYSMKVYSNGDFVMAGSESVTATKSKFVIARIKANGTYDASFGVNGIVKTQFVTSDEQPRAKTLVRQSDEKLTVVGIEHDSKQAALTRYLP